MVNSDKKFFVGLAKYCGRSVLAMRPSGD